MAILNPTMEVIDRLRVRPTEGERRLLNFLVNELDNSYEIFFQPFLNGDCPDIVILRRNSGVMFIEVKDWSLAHFYVDSNTNWRLRESNAHVRSPLNQVDQYKKHLYELHCEQLYEKAIENPVYWTSVKCAVYFNNATEHELRSFVTNGFTGDRYRGYNRWLQYMHLLGSDSLHREQLNSLLSQSWMNRASRYFDGSLYESIKRHLKAPFHREEEGIAILYSTAQQELIRSEIRPRRKIKGIAGCGKTFVMAKRAVNAYLRTHQRVLLLTFNLSLKNYIHDRISEVRENFPWDAFYINNYHQFFKQEANNHNLEITSLNCWEKTDFFESKKDLLEKYDCILIDEIQDYRQEWLDIITTYFMHDNSEFVVFGDEKQNIYEREMDENREPIVRKIPGAWNRSLRHTYRLGGVISNLAILFQAEMFNGKYMNDELENFQLDFEVDRMVNYYFADAFDPAVIIDKLFDLITSRQIHSSDVSILSSQVDLLQELDYAIRMVKHENTTAAFESKEQRMQILQEEREKIIEGENRKPPGSRLSENQTEELAEAAADDRIELIRRGKKNYFWYNTGCIKLSTVHSFKGWEAHTLVLIIPGPSPQYQQHCNEELIYTGLTRARRHLIIFNIDDLHYHTFFERHVGSVEIID